MSAADPKLSAKSCYVDQQDENWDAQLNDNSFVYFINLRFLVFINLHILVHTIFQAGPSFHHIIFMGHFIKVVWDKTYVYTGTNHKKYSVNNAVNFVPVPVLIEIEKRSVDKHVSELEADYSNHQAPNGKVEILDSILI